MYLVETNEDGEFEGNKLNDWFRTQKDAFTYAKESSRQCTDFENQEGHVTATVWRVDLPTTKRGFQLVAQTFSIVVKEALGANKCTPAGVFHNGKNLLEKSRHQKLHDKYWRLVRDEERRESDPQGLLIEIRETEAKLKLEAAKIKRSPEPLTTTASRGIVPAQEDKTMNDQEERKRVDWAFALSHFCPVDNPLGGVAYRAAERAVRNRIGAERLAGCAEIGPYYPEDDNGRRIPGCALVTEYDDQALACALGVDRAYYVDRDA
tara:strand:+ start:355 stop:1146 length:792 start_codon:yes stop_codon:yes gene_type:complete